MSRRDRRDERGGANRDRDRGPHLAGHLRERRIQPPDLIGRDPLEPAAAADEQAPEGPRDRIGHQPALMRQQRRRQQRLARARHEVVALGAHVLAQRHAAHAARERSRHLNVRREGEDQQRQHGPQQRGPGQDRPARGEQHHERRRQQAAPQVVEDLPARDLRQRVPDRAAAGVGHRAPQPPHDLPVAPHPAMLAGGERQVVRRVVVDEVRVGDEPRPGVEAFEQIVAQAARCRARGSPAPRRTRPRRRCPCRRSCPRERGPDRCRTRRSCTDPRRRDPRTPSRTPSGWR